MSLDPVTIQAIIEAVKDISLKATLALLLREGITNVSRDGYELIKETIRKKTTDKFGFAPNKDEANLLKKVYERPYYIEFTNILPKHDYADFIRIGYLVSHLNKCGNNQRAEWICDSIRFRPNGRFLIKSDFSTSVLFTGGFINSISWKNQNKKIDPSLVRRAYHQSVTGGGRFSLILFT